MGLVETLREAYDTPAVSAVAIEHDLQPQDGAGAPVASPTYMNGETPESTGFIPRHSDSGWLDSLVTEENGRPVSGMSVVLDSVASQSGRAEAALWAHRDPLGGLPGLVLRDRVAMSDGTFPVMVSSWEASHRHVDAWYKFAADSAGTPLWTSDNATRDLLTGINTTEDASTAFAYAPNSLLYGFWLSSGVVRRHRQARVYSSEIIGCGAHRHYGAAMKLDSLPVSRDTEVDVTQFGVRRKKNAQGKPSEAGFGNVVDQVRVLGYSCEVIAARAHLSLPLLRAMRYADDPGGERARAAGVALLVLGLAGDALGRQDTALRSGCDLLPVESRWGLRTIGKRDPEPLVVQQPNSVAWWHEQLAEALDACRAVGLEFADPVELSLSAPQQDVISSAISKQLESQETE